MSLFQLLAILLVHETDENAVLAVIEFAFLCLLPMQAGSWTLRDAKPAQKAIIFAWCIPDRQLCYHVVLSPAWILSF
jgi:hypothetical protein